MNGVINPAVRHPIAFLRLLTVKPGVENAIVMHGNRGMVPKVPLFFPRLSHDITVKK
jgi:hypothetical protein